MGRPAPGRRRKKKKKDKSSLIFLGIMGVTVLFAIGWMLNSMGLFDSLFNREDDGPAIHRYDFGSVPTRPTADTNTTANTTQTNTNANETTTNSGYEANDAGTDYEPAPQQDIAPSYNSNDETYADLPNTNGYANGYPGDANANDYASGYPDDANDNDYTASDDPPPYSGTEEYGRNSEILMLAEHFGNDDIIGRLVVLGTNIDIPVVQGADNYHYLYHNVSGDPSDAGWVFLDQGITLGTHANNTTIHGSMHPGILFYELARFADYEFFSTLPEIHFVTHYDHRVWEPFAFYSDTGGFAFTDTNYRNWDAWIVNFATRCEHLTDVEDITVTEYDEIITLVGTWPGSSTRYIVHARLVR